MEVGLHTRRRQPVQTIPAISRPLNFHAMTKYMAVYNIIIRTTYYCAGLKSILQIYFIVKKCTWKVFSRSLLNIKIS